MKPIKSFQTLRLILDALPEHLAVLDENGFIRAVNSAWRDFARENSCLSEDWVDVNYLEICRGAGGSGDKISEKAYAGIKSVLTGEKSRFQLEYPCDSPNEKRWFLMLAAPLKEDGAVSGVVISHVDITRQKHLETELRDRELYYRTLSDNTGDWAWLITPEGRFSYVSPSCEKITGYSSDEFKEDPTLLDRILHPKDRMRYKGSMRKKAGRSGDHYDEFQIKSKSGRWIWIGHLCRPVFSPEGEWIGRRASNRDITRQKELERELRRYEGIITSTPNLISLVDTNFIYRIVNNTYLKNLQLKKEDIVGRHVSELLGSDVFDNTIKDRLIRCFKGEIIRYDAWFDFPRTGNRCLDVTYFPYRSTDGKVRGAVVSGHDITDKKRLEEALERSENRLKEAQLIAHFGNFERDHETGAMFWSDEQYRLLGYAPGSMEPSMEALARRIHPEDEKRFHTDMDEAVRRGGSHNFEFRVIHDSGREVWLSGTLLVDLDETGRAVRTHGAFLDATRLKEAEKKLYDMANMDFLTGLNNRRRFQEICDQEMARSIRYDHPLSLLMMDADHFKNVNDSHGHDAGDAVLREIAKRAKARLRKSDFIGRIGGEEFAVLLPETKIADAAVVAESIRSGMESRPVDVNGTNVFVTVSIGVAGKSRKNGPEMADMFKDADNALYRAKNEGRNKVIVHGARSLP